jgi:spore maturation protein CgeB
MTFLLLTVGTINYNNDINFYEPLKDMGINVVRYNYVERMQQIGKRKMNREIIARAQSEHPDYIFLLTYQNQISPKTLRTLHQKGFRVIGWFSDDHWRFERYSKKLARYLYCSVTTDEKAIAKYETNNLRVIKSQWAANPKYYRRVPAKKNYEVTFVGQKYGMRAKVIDHLAKNGIPIQTFGKGWGEYIPFDEVITIFSNSRINVNISSSYKDSRVKQIKGRIFEVPMCGGFLLTDYVDGLEDYFKIGEEIVCYETQQDLVEKITYYLKNEKERKTIAMKGYRACQQRHTWRHRFTDIFMALDDMVGKGNLTEDYEYTTDNTSSS